MVRALTILFVLVLVFAGCDSTEKKRQAYKGIMDMTGYDLQRGNLVELKGEWRIWWDQFLRPGDSVASEGVLINVPRRWNNLPWDEGHLPGYGKATYQLTLTFDEQNIRESDQRHVVGLKIRDIHSAYRLFINGKHVFDKGNVNEGPSYRPLLGHETVFFEADTSAMVITIHVANYTDPRQSGMDEAIIFGPAKLVEKNLLKNNYLYALSFGVLFILFFYHLLLYSFRTRDTVNLYFAIACFLLSVQSVFMGEKAIYYLFPNLNANLYINILMASLLAVAFLFMYYNKLFPDEFPRPVVLIVTCFYSLECVYYLFCPYTMNIVAEVSYTVTLILAIYVFVALTVGVVRKREHALLIFAGTSFVILAGVNDTLHALEIVYTGYFTPVAFIIYTFSQSVLISFKFSQSFNKAEELSFELESLNQKLEGLVTERTRDLEEANKNLIRLNTTKDRFFSIIAHDLKGPVGTVNSALELAISSDPPEETRRDLLTIIYQSTGNTYKLLENLLEWARLQQGEIHYRPVVVKITEIVEHVEKLLAESAQNKGIILSSVVDENLKVLCDVNMIQTVLRNMVSNAIKFTPTGGKIWIKASSGKEEKVIVSVSDTGIGMSEILINKLFRIDEKITSKQGTEGEAGTGLGLIISHEFLAKHGSEINVESKLNSGSTFSFSLTRVR